MSGWKINVIHLTAMPNIMRKFGRKPTDLPPSQILYADTMDNLLGGSFVMTNTSVDMLLFESEYTMAMGSSPVARSFAFHYFNQDHLGNNREVVDSVGTVRLLTEEGYVTFSSSGSPQRHYFLRDHLGNIRVVMDAAGNAEQVNHYYAFGGLMRESEDPGVQPLKYGGKELDRNH